MSYLDQQGATFHLLLTLDLPIGGQRHPELHRDPTPIRLTTLDQWLIEIVTSPSSPSLSSHERLPPFETVGQLAAFGTYTLLARWTRLRYDDGKAIHGWLSHYADALPSAKAAHLAGQSVGA